jgi:dsDNA-specific endonuclease/ATPase MutS2
MKNRDRQGPRLFYDVQLDLHGMFADEAIMAVQHIVYANPSCNILIIHGRGSGVLRKTVREALRDGTLKVREYRFGEEINAPGLDGVTILYT